MMYVQAYAITLVAFLGIDALWLGLIARNFYATQLGALMRDNINFVAAGGFYLAYVVGIVFFAVAPALAEGSWKAAALRGALFGLLAYGTYDMTNLATIRNWPLSVSLVDMAWGTFLTAAAATIGYLATRSLSS